MATTRWLGAELAAAAAVLACWPAAATAQTGGISSIRLTSDQDTPHLDGREKYYEGAQAKFTTSAQPTPYYKDENGRPHKSVAGAADSEAEKRLYVMRFWLPADAPLDLGHTYQAGGAIYNGDAGIELTLNASICGDSRGSFTFNEYREQADGTPATIDVSFVTTCKLSSQQITVTGRYRLNASQAPQAPVLPKDTLKPRLSGLRLRPASFKARRGTRVGFRLSEAAQTTWAVQRAARGRKVGGRCRKPRRSNRKRRPCRRYVAMKGSVPFAGRVGANSFRFNGRLRGKRLPAGRYRFVATARDGSGNAGTPRRVAFRVTR